MNPILRWFFQIPTPVIDWIAQAPIEGFTWLVRAPFVSIIGAIRTMPHNDPERSIAWAVGVMAGSTQIRSWIDRLPSSLVVWVQRFPADGWSWLRQCPGLGG